MAIVVDTCSLVVIAKNFFSLDKKGTLAKFLETSFAERELLLLDAIYDELQYVSQGIVLSRFPFLRQKELIVPTSDLLPISPKKFNNMLDNNFCIRVLKNDLTNEQYIQQKEDFLRSGDGRILLYSLAAKDGKDFFCDYAVMTDESRVSNDNKLFKKLPLLCESIGVKTVTASEYLERNGFEISRLFRTTLY